MKSTTVSQRVQAWVVDYSAARTQAIRWLGERYLLARPINARRDAARKPIPRSIAESPALESEAA